MLTTGDRHLVHVPARLGGLELVTGGGTPDRPLLTSGLCLLVPDEGGGEVAPGRQPFPRVDGEQLLARAPTQTVPFLRAGGLRAPCRVLLLEPPLLETLGDGARQLWRYHSLLLSLPELVPVARQLCDAVERDAEADELRHCIEPLWAAVVAGFAAQQSRPAPLTPAVSRARDLLSEHFADELRLDVLARKAAVSKCHLVHLFHKELGLPPHAYQIQLRVAQARQLIISGTPLGEVAALTGFSDQSHLTRLFKRIVGVPPGQYAAARARRLIQAAPQPQPHGVVTEYPPVARSAQ